MAKSLKVLLDDTGSLKKMLGDDPWEFDLAGYYLKCDWMDRNALYVPNCLVVIEASRGEDDYFNCDHPRLLMDEKSFDVSRKVYIEDGDYLVEKELVLPSGIKEFFKGKTFDYYYTSLAVQLLFHVRNGIRNGV